MGQISHFSAFFESQGTHRVNDFSSCPKFCLFSIFIVKVFPTYQNPSFTAFKDSLPAKKFQRQKWFFFCKQTTTKSIFFPDTPFHELFFQKHFDENFSIQIFCRQCLCCGKKVWRRALWEEIFEKKTPLYHFFCRKVKGRDHIKIFRVNSYSGGFWLILHLTPLNWMITPVSF